MGTNSFGKCFQMTSFGESHGTAMGVVVEGCPANVVFDKELLQFNLLRRSPGQSEIVTDRLEPDAYEILSGIYKGRTLGTPISVIIKNRDARSEDYQNIEKEPRKGHADDVWKSKFGHSDPRGGGRSSGRETVSRVVAGSFAQMFLKSQCPQTEVIVLTESIYNLTTPPSDIEHLLQMEAPVKALETSKVRSPSKSFTEQTEILLKQAKECGESYGGVACVVIKNPQSSLGQPVFRKFKADLARACFSLGAVVGFELGEGFASASSKGTNFHGGAPDVYGGIRGGITTGETIVFRVAFKPTSSLGSVAKKGRHDPCIVPRALPVLEAMTYLVLADHVLLSRLDQA